MSGYRQLLKIRGLEEQCAKLGFRMGHSKHGGYDERYGDQVALFPADEALPIYTRDAQLFVGSFDELERWLQGVEWAQRYYKMLKVVDDKKVARKEQDERNRQLAQLIKNSVMKVD